MNVPGAPRTWSIVLAGGEGRRLSPTVSSWLGYHRPKQYCTFTGRRSMFQHTVDRADRIGGSGRRVTVFARHHLQDVLEQMDGRELGFLVPQPADRGTAVGAFAALSYVRAQDPQAVVALYPSDHFIHPESAFTALMRSAAASAEALGDRVLLGAARPDGPETDYGWITSGGVLPVAEGRPLLSVRAFREKPRHDEARSLLRAGALWNTLILVARVEALWELGRICFSEAMPLFDALAQSVGSSREAGALDAIYTRAPARNVCAQMFERVPERLAMFAMDGVDWSDWGRPARIQASLSRLGKRPAFLDPSRTLTGASVEDAEGMGIKAAG